MKLSTNDVIPVSYDVVKPQHQKRKKVIKKLIYRAIYSSFFVGVLFALGAGALLQKLYDISSSAGLIHQLYQVFWFGPTVLTWAAIVIGSVALLVIIRNKFSEKISGTLKVKK